MRIALMSPHDEILCFIDNSVPEAMHSYDRVLHTYLTGDAYTMEFKVPTTEKDSHRIQEGCKLSFLYQGRSYYLSIVKVIRDETCVSVLAWGLSLELTNEEVDKTSSSSLQSMEQYLNSLGFESEVIKIRINEVAGEKRYLTFDQRESILRRMYRLADAFDAEIAFEVSLNGYRLDHIDLDVFRAGQCKGAGKDRTGQVIRYGDGIQGIEKTSDISQLYTAIRPRGRKSKKKKTTKNGTRTYASGAVSSVSYMKFKDDQVTETREKETYKGWAETKINVTHHKSEGSDEVMPEKVYRAGSRPSDLTGSATTAWSAETETDIENTLTLGGFLATASDENGAYILTGNADDADLRCPQARDRFPAALTRRADGSFADGYIVKYMEISDAADQGSLYEAALKELKKNCVPKVSYTLTGHIDGEVGDWVTVEDAQYDPPIYLQCRIIEQETDPDDPSNCRTTFDNFTETRSQISDSIQRSVQLAVDSARLYDCSIISAQSPIYRENGESHQYQAAVRKDGVDITDEMKVIWMLNGTDLDLTGYPKAVSISTEDFDETATLGFRTVDANGRYRGSAQITLQKIDLPTISQEANADGSLTIKTESAGVTSIQKLSKGKDGISPTTSLSKSGKVTTFTVNDAAGTHSVQIHDGSDGQSIQGPPGVAGVGISGISKTYVRSSSYTTQPTSGWSTVPGTLTSTFPYMWERMAIDKTDGTTSYIYSVCAVRGSDGINGTNGTDGSDGVGISSITMKYYQSSSSTTPAQTSSSWSATLPTPTAGYYLHTQIQVTKTDGTSSYFYQKVRNGSNGSSPSVVNNVTSTSTTSALSANQGRILSNRLSALESSGTAASGVVVDLTAGDAGNNAKAAAVVSALRNGITPMIYTGSTYSPAVSTRLTNNCGVYTLTLHYYDSTCGYPNLTSITMYAPVTCG